MLWTKFPRFLTSFSTILLLQLALLPTWASLVQAQSASDQRTVGKRSPIGFIPPKGQPRPTVTVGGGRRNSSLAVCPQQRPRLNLSSVQSNTATNKPLTPLLPSDKLGLTVSSHPTFIVYVPESGAKSVELTLEDNKGKGIYQKTVDLKGNSGIVDISLPTTATALEIGKDYKLVVSVRCQQTGPKDPFVEGIVRRIQPDTALANRLQSAKTLEKVLLYAEKGIWFEAVTNLLQLKRSQPNNQQIASAWKELLQSAGLSEITNTPTN